MTNHPHQHQPKLHARNPFLSVAVASAIACIALTSCGEDEAPPAPIARAAPTPPPPPPPPPSVKSIAELMQELNIDPKVNLAEELAPDTTEKRIAVLLFWNAFAKGDSAYAATHMSELDRKVIDALAKNGSWNSTTAQITSIEVQCEDEDEGFATFGLITAGTSEQPLLWDAVMASDEATFTAFPGPADIMAHLSGENSVESWKKYVNGLFEKYSNLPDEEVEIPQADVVATDSPDAPTPSTEGGGGGGGGTGGGGAPMRNKPGAPVRGPSGPQ